MRIQAAITAALAALIIASCGEKDEPETTGAVVPIETATSTTATGTDPGTVPTSPTDVVRAFLVSPDAELVCDELITEKFLRASYGDRAGCLSARKPATLATSVQLSGEAEGVVKAKVSGGLYDGDELTFTLVGTGGAVQVDSVKSDAPVGP